jgi:hypothetical protein
MSQKPLRFKDLLVGDLFRFVDENYVRIPETPVGTGRMNAAHVGGSMGLMECRDDWIVSRVFIDDCQTATIEDFDEYMETPRGESLRRYAALNGFTVVYQHGQPGLEVERSHKVVCCFNHPCQMASFIRGIHTGLEWFKMDGSYPVPKPEWLEQLKRDAECECPARIKGHSE